jgi:hypothetical protein
MIRLLTLSNDNRKKEFGIIEYDKEIYFFTGKDFDKKTEPSFILTKTEIDKIIIHFKDKVYFILGNQVDNIKPNGFGEYYKNELRGSVKNTSHIASYLVYKKLLDYRHSNKIELAIHKSI